MEKNLEAQLRMNTVVDTLKSTPVRYATFVDKRTKMYFLQRILILPLVVGWDHHPRGSWKWQCSTVSDQSPNESKFSTSTKSLQSLPRDQSHRTSRHPQVKSFYSRKLGRLSNVTISLFYRKAQLFLMEDTASSVLRCYENYISGHSTALSQAVALQLLFDVRFVGALLLARDNRVWI